MRSKLALAPPVRRSGSPAEHLPPRITQLTAFGERAAWMWVMSADGTKPPVALDVFGIDLAAG